MRVEVIEFELTCPTHGVERMIVPVQFPRPRGCPHCFAPLVARHELRRFVTEFVPGDVGSEVWIG